MDSDDCHPTLQTVFPFKHNLASLLRGIGPRRQSPYAESHQDLTTTSPQVPAMESPEYPVLGYPAPESLAPNIVPALDFPQFFNLPKELQLQIRPRRQPQNAESHQDSTATSLQVPAFQALEYQAPDSVATTGIDLTTFPQFLSLPKELQLNIWRFAASPHGLLFLEPGFIMHTCFEARRHISRLFPDVLVTSFPHKDVLLYDILSRRRIVGFRTRFGEDSDNFVANSGARLLLKMTCRLARQVVFEVWKRDIGGIEVASNRILAKGSDEVLWSEIAVKRRKEVAEGLDMLIRDTERGFITHGFGEENPRSESLSNKRRAEETMKDEPLAKRQRLSSTIPILVLRGAVVTDTED